MIDGTQRQIIFASNRGIIVIDMRGHERVDFRMTTVVRRTERDGDADCERRA